MLSDFKSFLMKGNVIGLAVAVIIGGAFGKIVDSLVGDIIGPIISMATGGEDVSKLWEVNGVKIGSFVQAIINFVIIGLVLFMLVKAANKRGMDVEPQAS